MERLKNISLCNKVLIMIAISMVIISVIGKEYDFGILWLLILLQDIEIALQDSKEKLRHKVLNDILTDFDNALASGEWEDIKNEYGEIKRCKIYNESEYEDLTKVFDELIKF